MRTKARIVAYSVGSFWYCLDHGRGQQNAEPVLSSQLHPEYIYKCDKCRVVLPKLEEPPLHPVMDPTPHRREPVCKKCAAWICMKCGTVKNRADRDSRSAEQCRKCDSLMGYYRATRHLPGTNFSTLRRH